jgi:hypothetical protein
MGTRGQDWNDVEMLRVLAFYASQTNYPDKEEFRQLCSKLPNRTAASITLRLGNYSARDPKQKQAGKVGLHGGGKNVDLIWAKYSDGNGFLDSTKLLRACSLQL